VVSPAIPPPTTHTSQNTSAASGTADRAGLESAQSDCVSAFMVRAGDGGGNRVEGIVGTCGAKRDQAAESTCHQRPFSRVTFSGQPVSPTLPTTELAVPTRP
jgi:hypothetical protein